MSPHAKSYFDSGLYLKLLLSRFGFRVKNKHGQPTTKIALCDDALKQPDGVVFEKFNAQT